TAIIDRTDDWQLFIDFARSTQWAADLCRRRKTIEQLRRDNRLAEIHPLLPELRSFDDTCGEGFLACARPAGPTALDLVRSGVANGSVCRVILDGLEPLHRLTGGHQVVSEEDVDRWIEEPVARLATLGRASVANAEQLRRLLVDGFVGRVVDVGRIHGELALDNVVMSVEPLAMTGLLRWERSSEMPVVVDRATLALIDLALRGDAELGEIVTQLLVDPSRFEDHPAVTTDPDPSLPSRAVILLTWLSLVGRPLPAHRTMSSDMFWLARNAQPVLASLDPAVGLRS
ncbi:MAG: hypothetical protein ACR2QK_16435, partial [Acidimicrobiales bacterium]